MSEDPFPGSSADFYERIQELKAEIERLKAEYLKLDEQLEQALRKNENQATLITELADALEEADTMLPYTHEEVIRRAREVAK